MDINFEIKNGLCVKGGLQYSFFNLTGGSSSGAISSWGGNNVSSVSNNQSWNLDVNAQMFRAKFGTYKKIFFRDKEKFNVGIDFILPFEKLPPMQYNRTISVNGNDLIQDHTYSVWIINTTFYCKYNFVNFNKNSTKKITAY